MLGRRLCRHPSTFTVSTTLKARACQRLARGGMVMGKDTQSGQDTQREELEGRCRTAPPTLWEGKRDSLAFR